MLDSFDVQSSPEDAGSSGEAWCFVEREKEREGVSRQQEVEAEKERRERHECALFFPWRSVVESERKKKVAAAAAALLLQAF